MRLSLIDHAEQAALFLHDCDGAYAGTHAEMCLDLNAAFRTRAGSSRGWKATDVDFLAAVRTCMVDRYRDPKVFEETAR